MKTSISAIFFLTVSLFASASTKSDEVKVATGFEDWMSGCIARCLARGQMGRTLCELGCGTGKYKIMSEECHLKPTDKLNACANDKISEFLKTFMPPQQSADAKTGGAIN